MVGSVHTDTADTPSNLTAWEYSKEDLQIVWFIDVFILLNPPPPPPISFPSVVKYFAFIVWGDILLFTKFNCSSFYGLSTIRGCLVSHRTWPTKNNIIGLNYFQFDKKKMSENCSTMDQIYSYKKLVFYL